METPLATIDYIEMPATDLEATKRFYTDAFGWRWIDYGPTYASRDGDGVEIALNAIGTPAPQHQPGEQNGIGPLVLFSAVDLEEVLAAVRAAGGEVVTEVYDYPGGHRFHFSDPSGNVLGVYCSDSA